MAAGSNFLDAKKAVDQLTEALRLHMEVIDKSVVSLNKLNKEYTELPSDYIKTQKQLLDLRRQEERAQQELIKTQQQLERLKQQELKTDQDSNRVKQQILRTEQQVERSKQQQQRTLASESRTRQVLTREQQQQQRIAERELRNLKKVNGAYQRLRDSLNRAEKEYKELAAAQGLNNKATIEAQRTVNRLRNQVDAINKPINRMNENVGNYPKNFGLARKAIGQLIGAFGLMEVALMAIRKGWDIFKESLTLAREATGVEFAFERLGEAGVKAFDDVRKASRGTLSELDIKRALVEFDNFNLDIQQAGDLFEFLTVRATQTGRSVEYLRDSLVEGLSKESKLRIDNLGISASELNEELEKTPNFVEAVANIARREVAEAGDILDKAANSSTRFSAAIEDAKLALGQLLTSTDSSVLSGISGWIERITSGLKYFRIAVLMLERGVNALMTPIRALANEVPMIQRSFTFLAAFWRSLFMPGLTLMGDIIMRVAGFFGGLGGAITSVISSIKGFLSIVSMLGDLNIDWLNPQRTADQAKAILKSAGAVLGKAGENAADAYRQGFDKVFEKGVQKTSELLDKESNEFDDNTEKKKQALQAIKGSIGYYEQLISSLENERKLLATNSIEYNSYKDRINEASMALNNLKTQLNGVNAIDLDLDKAKAMEDFFKALSEGSGGNRLGLDIPDVNEGLKAELEEFESIEARKTAIAEAESQRRIDIAFESLERFGEAYGVDLSKFRNLFDEKKNTLSDYTAAAQEIVGFALNQRLSGYDLEIQKAAEARDAILNNERASEEQRRKAEQEFEKKEAKIKRERAKKERENALIQIAVNTAVGVTKALATTPPPGSFVLAGIITAMGALQAGLVASQPLPQFEKGTDNAPQGWAIVDEAGPELHTDKSGRVKSTGSSKGANLRYLEKGDKIFPYGSNIVGSEVSQLQGLLWNLGVNLGGDDKEEKDDRMLNELQGLRKDNKSLKKTMSSIANRPINITIEDKSKGYYG